MMYRPPWFQEDRPEILRAAMQAHPLATLVTSGVHGLNAQLVPVLCTNADGAGLVLQAHLARANPQVADLRDGGEAVVLFQGPQAYISPSWYPSKHEHGRVVPTWNYVVVQARGRGKVVDDREWLLSQVTRLTAQQEQRNASPWAVSDAPAEYIDRQLKAIIGLEIVVESIEGKWKVSQNQAASNRAGVVEGLKALDPCSPMAALVEAFDPESV